MPYGHHSRGRSIVTGSKDTVPVLDAGMSTSLRRTTGAPLPGGVIVALTVPRWRLVELLVTSSFTVSLADPGLFCWTTCAFEPASASESWSWTGNWMPVLLSGGIWLQSRWETVSIFLGLLGYIMIAKEFRPGWTSEVTSKVCPAYAPLTMSRPATSVPFTQTSPSPTTPGTISRAFCREVSVKSVRNHHGTAKRGTVTGPRLLM